MIAPTPGSRGSPRWGGGDCGGSARCARSQRDRPGAAPSAGAARGVPFPGGSPRAAQGARTPRLRSPGAAAPRYFEWQPPQSLVGPVSRPVCAPAAGAPAPGGSGPGPPEGSGRRLAGRWAGRFGPVRSRSPPWRTEQHTANYNSQRAPRHPDWRCRWPLDAYWLTRDVSSRTHVGTG